MCVCYSSRRRAVTGHEGPACMYPRDTNCAKFTHIEIRKVRGWRARAMQAERPRGDREALRRALDQRGRWPHIRDHRMQRPHQPPGPWPGVAPKFGGMHTRIHAPPAQLPGHQPDHPSIWLPPCQASPSSASTRRTCSASGTGWAVVTRRGLPSARRSRSPVPARPGSKPPMRSHVPRPGLARAPSPRA